MFETQFELKHFQAYCLGNLNRVPSDKVQTAIWVSRTPLARFLHNFQLLLLEHSPVPSQDDEGFCLSLCNSMASGGVMEFKLLRGITLDLLDEVYSLRDFSFSSSSAS
jgi:hypothetical protein